MFEAGKLSATTADHSGRDHCGGCSSSLSEWCCESVTVGDGEWIHRLGPPLGRSAKVGGGVLQRQPDQRRRRSIVREVAGRLDDLEQSRIDALDRVGCLDYMPHARRGGKKRNHPSPALAPERREGWMSLAPGAALEFYERLPSGVCVDCGVNRPEYLGFEFAVLPARVLEALSDQVRDAGRQGHGRRCRSQVRWSALLAMGHCELDIPKPASVDAVDDRQPELTRLGAFDPDPRDVTRPMWENAEREINRLVADLHVLAGLHPHASKNTAGYTGSSWRRCRAVTSAITASITELIISWETSVLYGETALGLPRTVTLRAYMTIFLSSMPAKRRSCVRIGSGSKLPPWLGGGGRSVAGRARLAASWCSSQYCDCSPLRASPRRGFASGRQRDPAEQADHGPWSISMTIVFGALGVPVSQSPESVGGFRFDRFLWELARPTAYQLKRIETFGPDEQIQQSRGAASHGVISTALVMP